MVCQSICKVERLQVNSHLQPALSVRLELISNRVSISITTRIVIVMYHQRLHYKTVFFWHSNWSPICETLNRRTTSLYLLNLKLVHIVNLCFNVLHLNLNFVNFALFREWKFHERVQVLVFNDWDLGYLTFVCSHV